MDLKPLRFATTAARLAYTFVANDVGRRIAHDLQNGHIYVCKAEGTGAACMSSMTGTDVIVYGVPLNQLQIISTGGDVGNIAANAGQLASDSDPIFRGDAAESGEIGWATGSVVPVGFWVSLTGDEIDDTRDMTLELDVYSGTTDAATFTAECSFNGAALVSTACSDSATKSATRHTITGTILAATVPASARHLTVALTPTNAHATNAYQLCGVRIKAFRK